MNAQEFVEAIKVAVLDSSIHSVKEYVTCPPGKSPKKELVELSEWFNNNTDENKKKILEVIKLSVESSVFGFLCVLDGVRAIEKTQDKGHLVLYFEKDGIRELLNDPEGDFLHDLL